ncbi:DNA repair/transcription protein MET18/MMS19 [Kwoniella heveanensis CBS 569]|nr:DNA repair/transcription protein MET18/MMS19 [Kwoniella heveanensis CBS 569]
MDVPRIVRTQISTSELDPPKELLEGVNGGQVGLLEVIKALGEYLTSPEDDVRLKGLTFLSNLLKVITPSKVNRQATATLTNFYLSKLDDFDSLPPALQGLTILSKLPTFDDSAAVDVYKGIVENVNMKSYVQATRHLVYVLFDSLLATHRSALKEMGTAFVNSYTKMVDGEKDPRNLMLLFSIDRVILLEFDVKDHIEDFFDITFCYFPISFRPPPNDPYGITAEDLKLALRKCMAASPYFAKMALPLFLEKFSTSTGQSMKDLMLSIAACIPVYGAEAVRERGSELWEGIKTEVFYSSDTSIEAAALSAFESLIRALYPTEKEPATGLAQDIIKECLAILNEPEKSQAMAATKILAAMLRASVSAGIFAFSQVFPQLFKQFNTPPLPSHRAPLLSTISSLLIAAQSVYTPESVRRQSQERSLEPFRGGILDVLREGLRTEGLKGPAIKGSEACVQIAGFWGREEVEDVVRGMNDILINDNDPETRAEAVSALTTISTFHPTVIEAITLPLMFHSLPDTAPPASDFTGRDKYRSILGSLTELCAQPALFQTLVIRVTTKLDLLASSSPAQDADDNMGEKLDGRECTVVYAWDLLNSLVKVIEQKTKAKHIDLSRYFDQLIPRIWTLVISAAGPRTGGDQPLFRDRRLLALVGRIGEQMIYELSSERQSKWLEAVYNAFEKGAWAEVVHAKAQVRLSGSSLRNGASSSEQDLIALYSTAIQGLKNDVRLPFDQLAAFLSSKVHWTIRVARDQWQVKYALDLICAFVNKREAELRDSLEDVLTNIWNVEVQDTSKDLEVRKRALLVYLHIVKALALLRAPLAYTALDRVIEILNLSNLDPDYVGYAASGFGILASGKGKSHLTAKLLHAQKLWNHVLAKLIAGDKEASGKDRLVYLVAFASLLPLVPASLCLSDLSTILPLILRSLSLSDPKQRTNAITTLTSILETASDSKEVDKAIHAKAVDMVQSLLKSALIEADVPSSPKVRIAALAALSLFPDVIRFEALHTQKSTVIKQLGRALDDPLRSVRKEAVECRAKWYRYGNAT